MNKRTPLPEIGGPLAIIFYETDGKGAKEKQVALSKRRDERNQSAKVASRVYDVKAWRDSPDGCDLVIIMPDVTERNRERIEAIFGKKVEGVAGFIPPVVAPAMPAGGDPTLAAALDKYDQQNGGAQPSAITENNDPPPPPQE